MPPPPSLLLPLRSRVINGSIRSSWGLCFRGQQRRWAQVHDVRFLATHHDPNRVLEKYREKLDQKAKEEGHDSVESLKEAYKVKISEYRQRASTIVTSSSKSVSPSIPFAAASSSPPSSPSAATAAKSIFQSTPAIQPLSSYLDIEKILTLPTKEIETLWRLRHANNPRSICAVIPLDTYQRMASAAQSHPQFILPLPRRAAAGSAASSEHAGRGEEGLEASAVDIHFLQWGFHPPASPATTTTINPSHPNTMTTTATAKMTANMHTSTIIFTCLAAYKVHGSYTQPHTTITHYLDLADAKGLVLLHGQVMPDRGVSVTEASWLVSCVQRFYDLSGQGSGRKGELLRMFTRGDVDGFRIEDLVNETERIS